MAAGVLFFPPNYSPQAKHPAIVIAHPMTAVKEQSPGLYALTLAPAGYICLTFDAAIRTKAWANHAIWKTLTSELRMFERQSPTFLSAMMSTPSTSTDLRIKTVATVSAVCTGRMARDGLLPGLGGPETLRQLLQAAPDARITEAKGEEASVNPSLPPTVEDVPAEAPADIKTLAEYYKTPRGQHERCTSLFATRSASLLGNFDAFAFNNLISPRPLLIIAGEDDGSLLLKELVSLAGSLMQHDQGSMKFCGAQYDKVKTLIYLNHEADNPALLKALCLFDLL
ncbi:hypothetical protein BJX65DRAFT_313275 [Aspergillus insuetus]